MKIKFLEDQEVQDLHAGTPNATRFKKGKTYDLNDASANHWLIRGFAERVTTRTKPRTPDPAPEADPE